MPIAICRAVMDPESDHETLHGVCQGLLRRSAAVNLLIPSKSPTSAGCWGACETGGSTASPKAIRELLVRLNEERPLRRLGVTRRQLHEELDRPALKPLPVDPTSLPNGAPAGSGSTITST